MSREMKNKVDGNPYATKKGEPKDGKFAEWFQWEKKKDAERRATMTPEQLEAEDGPSRKLQARMQAESEFIKFDN